MSNLYHKSPTFHVKHVHDDRCAVEKNELIDQLLSLVESWESADIHPDHESGCRIAAAQLRELLNRA